MLAFPSTLHNEVLYEKDSFQDLCNTLAFQLPLCRVFIKTEINVTHTRIIFFFTPFRSTSPEDMQEKYIRVLSTSLVSYGLFIEQLVYLEDSSKKMKALEKVGFMHSNILKDPKFWKLAHHSNLTVKYFFFDTYKRPLRKILFKDMFL